jgi:hypothetical protein
MNESLVNQKSDQYHDQTTLFGLQRPAAGATIGILLFLISFFVIWETKSIFLVTALLAPGVVTMMAFQNVDMPLIGHVIIAFSTSSILPAIIGSLIVSKQNATRINGIILLIIYLFTSAVLGMFLLTYGSVA